MNAMATKARLASISWRASGAATTASQRFQGERACARTRSVPVSATTICAQWWACRPGAEPGPQTINAAGQRHVPECSGFCVGMSFEVRP